MAFFILVTQWHRQVSLSCTAALALSLVGHCATSLSHKLTSWQSCDQDTSPPHAPRAPFFMPQDMCGATVYLKVTQTYNPSSGQRIIPCWVLDTGQIVFMQVTESDARKSISGWMTRRMKSYIVFFTLLWW